MPKIPRAIWDGLTNPQRDWEDFGLHEEHTPEQRLWAASLLHAVREAGKGDMEELDWIFTFQFAWHIGSYNWICETLEIDPECLRELLIARWKWVKGYLHRKNIGRPDYDRREYVRRQRARGINYKRRKLRGRSRRYYCAFEAKQTEEEKNGSY